MMISACSFVVFKSILWTNALLLTSTGTGYIPVCVSFIRTTMKVQLDTEIAIQIYKKKSN